MSCRDCELATLRLARLRAKHRNFARATNELLTEQAREIAELRAAAENEEA